MPAGQFHLVCLCYNQPNWNRSPSTVEKAGRANYLDPYVPVFA
jgi:hypothetical protein